MSAKTLSELEKEIVDYLHGVDAPRLPSLIAAGIGRTKRETTVALLELECKGILYSEPDFTLLALTGERDAFGLRKLNQPMLVQRTCRAR
jgi:hypothetical protein